MPGKGMEEETYSAAQTAKVLGLSRRHVLNLLHSGGLEGFQEKDGWKVYQRSVHALRDRRPEAPRSPSEGLEAHVWIEQVRELERALGRLEGQRELSEITESTLREGLERERQRADKAEADLEAERARGFWARLFR